MTLDYLITYVEEKGISTYKLATASGYSRSYVRLVIKDGHIPKQETIDIFVEAALDVGEITSFNRHEMGLLHKLIHYRNTYSLHGQPTTPYKVEKPDSMT